MKLKRGMIFLFAVLIITIISFSVKINIDARETLTTKQKLEDFNYMYNILKSSFPFFEVKKRMLGYDWLAHKSEFESMIIETKNNQEFYQAMNKIINSIQNAHTHILDEQWFNDLKQIYENPQGGYSPARKQVLNNPISVKKYSYWSKIINKNYSSYIPIVFRYVEGRYVVIDGNLMLNGIPKGSILMEADDKIIDEYISSLSDQQYLAYDYSRKKPIIEELIITTINKNKIKLKLKTPDGKIIEKLVRPGLFLDLSYDQNESEENSNYTTKILEDKRTAYIQLKSMWAEDRFRIENDRDEIYKFLQQVQDYQNLIIDIRGNGGGNTGYWKQGIVGSLVQKTTIVDTYIAYKDSEYIKPFIKDRFDEPGESILELPENKKYPLELKSDFGYFYTSGEVVIPRNPINFKGKIYLLIDGGVYSAAESFAVYAKNSNWATLIGTTSGGDGIGTDPALMALPNSGLIVRFSCVMGVNPDGTVNEEAHTSPNIYIEQHYDDYMQFLNDANYKVLIGSPYDSVLNETLKLINNAF